ncbi:hypothetical protein D9757_007931 [Collybiopsis confluens]|uniref:Uncharacterized protein n=1 Tax=Collybiopsis confluens TaxID=2823264 RepID=A0A8H5HBJ3_9AGAR|nr:hypothetical protein D9757_007931 [Collybiopsis confluens]
MDVRDGQADNMRDNTLAKLAGCVVGKKSQELLQLCQNLVRDSSLRSPSPFPPLWGALLLLILIPPQHFTVELYDSEIFNIEHGRPPSLSISYHIMHWISLSAVTMCRLEDPMMT